MSRHIRSCRFDRNIVVIPNFLDCSIHRRLDVPDLRQRFTGGDSSVQDRHARVELPSGQTDRSRARNIRPHSARGAGAPAARGRRSGARKGVAPRSRVGDREPRRHRRRAGRGRAAAVGERRISAAVNAGKLRPCGARGDGVRGARRGIARRRAPRSDRARRSAAFCIRSTRWTKWPPAQSRFSPTPSFIGPSRTRRASECGCTFARSAWYRCTRNAMEADSAV